MRPRRSIWASISSNQRLREWLTGEAKPNFSIRSHFHSATTFCNCSEKPQSAAGSTPLSERGPFVSRLNSRGILSFYGPDTVKFLQGLVTNDLRTLEEPTQQPVPTPNQPAVQKGPVSAAFLNSQGRFLYDIFIYRPVRADEKLNATGSGPGADSNEPALLADVDSDSLHELLDHLNKGEAIPLEYNLAGLNAISFEKGCYVGQELVARTHHRGVIRKRILPVHFTLDSGEEVQQKVAPKSELINADSGKAVGTVTTVLASRGLALLRLEAALKNSNRLNLKGLESIKVEVVQPKWWPREWGQEEEQ